MIDCYKCRGRGKIKVTYDQDWSDIEKCKRCLGAGKLLDSGALLTHNQRQNLKTILNAAKTRNNP